MLEKDPFLLESWDMSFQLEVHLPLYQQRDGNENVEYFLEAPQNHHEEPSRTEEDATPIDELDT